MDLLKRILLTLTDFLRPHVEALAAIGRIGGSLQHTYDRSGNFGERVQVVSNDAPWE
jgi:hypothetical protein